MSIIDYFEILDSLYNSKFNEICVLCQEVPYQLLEENDEHIERKNYPTNMFVHFSPFEDDEDVSSLEEDTKCLNYMEQLNKYLSKIHVENILEDLLMELVQYPCMEDCVHEDSEVELPVQEENDYLSLL